MSVLNLNRIINCLSNKQLLLERTDIITAFFISHFRSIFIFGNITKLFLFTIKAGILVQFQHTVHLVISERINTICVFFEKMVKMIAKWNKVYQAPSLSFIETNKFSSSIFVIAKTFFPI